MKLLRVAFGVILLAMVASWVATSGIRHDDEWIETRARDAARNSGAAVIELRQPFRTSFRYGPAGCDDTALVTLQSILTNPYTLLPQDHSLGITTYYFESKGDWPGRLRLIFIWMQERFAILLGQRRTLPTTRMIMVYTPDDCINAPPISWRTAFE